MPASPQQQLNYLLSLLEKLFTRVQYMYDIINDQSKTDEFLLRCERLDKTFEEYNLYCEKIMNLNTLLTDETERVDVSPKILAFEDVYYKIQVAYRAALAERAQSALPPRPLTESSKQTSKLPQIDIRKFSGEKLEEFTSFIALYNKIIHTRESLASIEKFSYLVSLLDGPALRLVQAVQFSEENYEIAYNRLVERYQNERVLANYYANKILQAKPSPSESLSGLRVFLDQVYVNVQSLKALNIEDLADYLFLHLGLRSLDPHTKKLFENEFVKV